MISTFEINGVQVPVGTLVVAQLDEAVIGCLMTKKEIKLVYDYEKCIEIFMKVNGWDREGAVDWMGFNVESLGPLFLTEEDIEEWV